MKFSRLISYSGALLAVLSLVSANPVALDEVHSLCLTWLIGVQGG
jgi:hypothetical protein